MKHHRLLENVTHLAVLATLAGYFFAPSTVNAAQSAWVRSEGGDIRIVAEKALPDGTIPAILDIRLKPGWKTYWLEPGASGIPPQVTIDPKDGITFSGLRFPAPKTFDDGVVRYTGYDTSVAFPMSLTRATGGDVTLKASVFMGICKDICIPVQADLSVPLKERQAENPLEKARIDDAVAALPEEASDSFRVVSASFDRAAKVMRLTLAIADMPAGTLPELFLAGPPGYSFGKPANLMRVKGQVTAEVPVKEPQKAGALKSGAVLLVARAGARSMQTALAFD